MPKFNVDAIVMAKMEMPIIADTEEAARAKFMEIARYEMELDGYSEITFDISRIQPDSATGG